MVTCAHMLHIQKHGKVCINGTLQEGTNEICIQQKQVTCHAI